MTLIGTLDAPQQQDEADVLPKLDFSERLSPVATLHGAYAMVVEWRKSVRVAKICFVKEESRKSLWTYERNGRSQKPQEATLWLSSSRMVAVQIISWVCPFPPGSRGIPAHLQLVGHQKNKKGLHLSESKRPGHEVCELIQ